MTFEEHDAGGGYRAVLEYGPGGELVSETWLAPLEKSMSPRSIPPDAAVEGLRAAEERFAEVLYGLVRDGMRAVLKAETEPAALEAARAEARRFSEEAEAEARAHIADVYGQLVAEARGETPHARMEDADFRNLQMLESLPDGLMPALAGLSADVQRDVEKAVRTYWQAGTDVLRRELGKVAVAPASRLETIARTETSRVANLGRAAQVLKYAGEGARVDWVLAAHPRGDFRTCDTCRAIAGGGRAVINKREVALHGNPYGVAELEALVPHLVAHPNERCVVARRP